MLSQYFVGEVESIEETGKKLKASSHSKLSQSFEGPEDPYAQPCWIYDSKAAFSAGVVEASHACGRVFFDLHVEPQQGSC